MGQLRILLIGDGRHELGSRLDEPLVPRDLPPLGILVHRLLGKPENASFVSRRFRDIGQARVTSVVRTVQDAKISAFARKAAQGIAKARAEGFDAVVILIDRDRRTNAETIDCLSQGRDSVTQKMPSPRCAVGVAIETFDAWMIVDGAAIGDAGGDASHSFPEAEGLDGDEQSGRHPKTKAAQIFGSGEGLGDKYAAVAKHVRLDLLSKLCDKGFAPFAREVQAHLLPLLQG